MPRPAHRASIAATRVPPTKRQSAKIPGSGNSISSSPMSMTGPAGSSRSRSGRNSRTTRPRSSMRAAGAAKTWAASSRAIATGFRNSSPRCRKTNPAARGAVAMPSARTGQRPRATAASPRTCRPEQTMPRAPSEKPRSRRRNEARSRTIVNRALHRQLRRRRAPVPASPLQRQRRCPTHRRGVRPKRRSPDRPRRKSTRVVSPAPRVWR